jgi:hypothetical protein
MDLISIARGLTIACAVYVGIGALVALGFVAFAVRAIVPGRPRVSFGARVMLLPGAAFLWPLVARRSLAPRSGEGSGR